MKDTNTTGPDGPAHETDAFGNYYDEDGRLIIVERPRTYGRNLNYRHSTSTERDIAQEYSDGDLTVKQIAEIYETSQFNVRYIALNHGVPMRVPAMSYAKTKIDVKQALRLRKAGFSITEIAELLGETKEAVTGLFGRTPEAKLTHAESMARRRAKLSGPHEGDVWQEGDKGN